MRAPWPAALAALFAIGCTTRVLECPAGFADCDGDPQHICEVDLTSRWACGACGNNCVSPHRSSACVDGRCVRGECALGWADCDGDPTNGCESLSGTVEWCLRCGIVPPLGAHQSPVPNGPTCTVRCDEGFTDCDGDRANGCEVETRRDVANCGACGRTCAAGERCAAGVCSPPCREGTAECDASGVCTDLRTSAWACGACGHRCDSRANAEATCEAGVCGYRCYAQYGYGDCDGDAANGCEAHLHSSSAHCGACENACEVGGACIDGVCHPPCSATYRDCVSSDGRCETDTLTSPDHCGACGARCIGSYANGHLVCAVGTCERICDPGFADCDGAPANGCEVDLSSNDGAHCGACGRACAMGEACVSGVCSLPAPRQWRPQSLSITTTRHPTFAWHLSPGIDGARLEVCADRACTRVEHTANVTGSSYRPPESVVFNEGVHYWSLWGRSGERLATAHGPTWLFRTPATDAAYDTAWRIINDVDGDGVEDVLSGAGADRVLELSTGARVPISNYGGFPYYREDFGSRPGPLSVTTSADFAGDLDGDGFGDLVGVASAYYNPWPGSYWSDDRVVLLRGRLIAGSAATWSALNDHTYVRPSSEGSPPLLRGVGDVDGDGFVDLGGALLSYLAPPHVLLERSSNGYRDEDFGWGGAIILSGDTDGDGRSEPIVLWDGCGASATFACAGTFRREPEAFDYLPLTGACAEAIGGSTPAISIDDFNGDGLADLQLGFYVLSIGSRVVRFLGGPGGLTGDRCELVP